jgi:adenylate cyclase
MRVNCMGLRGGAGAAILRSRRGKHGMAAVADFAEKFGLVLKACNLSRGRVAQIVGVDKSVVSRWASGVQAPTDHNLTLLTEAVARHWAGFARVDWDIDPKAFAVRVSQTGDPAGGKSGPALPRQPASEKLHSILVLPFASVGEQAEQLALAEAITDDLTHDLSRIPGTLVIAQGTANTLKGRSVDARAAAREFAVRYVVDGSVRIGPDRVRINIQLVDAETGGQLWSERIEAPRAELADLQENVSGRIAWALELELPGVESRSSRRGGGPSSDAFELGMLGWSLMNRPPARENLRAAEAHFERACALDPGALPARIGLSFTLVRRVSSYWSDTPQDDLQRAHALIDAALVEAPRHDRGHFVKGLILRTEAQPEPSSVYFERAVELNPNYAQAIAFLGFNRALVGLPEQSFELFDRAIRLSPRDPQLGVWLTFVCGAHIQLGQFDRAGDVASRAVALNPEYGPNHLALARARVMAGRREEAQAALANALRLLPGLTARALRARRMSMHPDVVEMGERVLGAMREIGLPD